MQIKRRASAVWHGSIKEGGGHLSTESGALAEYPYAFGSRFEGRPGTNPEELIAAAHAGCFTMALSLALTEAKFAVVELSTTAEVTLEKGSDGFSVTASHLTLRAKIPGGDSATFGALAQKAKANCPISKLLKAEITLDAALTEAAGD